MESDRLLAVRAGGVRTLDAGRRRADYLAVRGDRVEAVGTVEEVKSRVGAGAAWLDLRPAVIVPGLTDSHIHLVEWALGLGAPSLSDAGSMAEVLARVGRAVGAAPEDAWLEFKGWNPAWRPQAELGDLDRAAAGAGGGADRS